MHGQQNIKITNYGLNPT